MNNNVLFQFLAELVSRLFSGKPKFFVIIQWVSVVVGAVSVLVNYLTSSGVVLPDWTQTVSDMSVTVGSVVAIIMAQLPKKDPA
jgi:hypothetical protein